MNNYIFIPENFLDLSQEKIKKSANLNSNVLAHFAKQKNKHLNYLININKLGHTKRIRVLSETTLQDLNLFGGLDLSFYNINLLRTEFCSKFVVEPIEIDFLKVKNYNGDLDFYLGGKPEGAFCWGYDPKEVLIEGNTCSVYISNPCGILKTEKIKIKANALEKLHISNLLLSELDLYDCKTVPFESNSYCNKGLELHNFNLMNLGSCKMILNPESILVPNVVFDCWTGSIEDKYWLSQFRNYVNDLVSLTLREFKTCKLKTIFGKYIKNNKIEIDYNKFIGIVSKYIYKQLIKVINKNIINLDC